MTPAENIAEALKVGGKTRGFTKAVYRPSGAIDHYMRQHIELICDDVLAVAKAFPVKENAIAMAQIQGCGTLPPGTHVVLLADDAFHLINPPTATPEAPPATSA